ncbi:MAG: hypothetical protein K2K48_01495 [Anaeroplasmataceae bacterium]|nr:hypothetical protein [Anaeroplasmataceae bacterium]MDE6414065.1 hypothetical protein [Anaeroplasmataceae bacterium]
MKIKTLEDQYNFSCQILSVFMPILSAVLTTAGVVLAFALKEVFWVGLILIAIGILVLIEFVFIRKYLLKKMKFFEENRENSSL